MKTFFHQVLDQIGHVTYAAVLVAAFILPIPIIFAVLAAIWLGILRELNQHDRGWDFSRMSKLDLGFWILGTIIGSLIILIISPAGNFS